MPHVPTAGGPALMAASSSSSSRPRWWRSPGNNLERPNHWKARYDDGTSAPDRRFVVMRPGWHVFSGPGGLFWDPGSFASGAFGVSRQDLPLSGGRPGSIRLHPGSTAPSVSFSPAATWTVTLPTTSRSSCASTATSGSPGTAAARLAISYSGRSTTRS